MHASYLLVLTGCVLVTLPLELYYRADVYRRPRRWLASLGPVLVPFVAWDVWAIAQGHWRYDVAQTVDVRFPGDLPLEELLFFVVIPTCAILTFEAMRAATGWWAGDEDRS